MKIKVPDFYVWQSTRNMFTRFAEHWSNLNSGNLNSSSQIPAYKHIRRLGLSSFFVVPILCLNRSTRIEMERLERAVICALRPTLNCPRVWVLDKSGSEVVFYSVLRRIHVFHVDLFLGKFHVFCATGFL